MKKKPTLVLIHGNGATPESFNYINKHLEDYKRIYLAYDSNNGFFNNLECMVQALDDVQDDLFFITHSLGGIYGLHLIKYFSFQIVGAVSLATPFGGCEGAPMLRLLTNAQVYKDVSPYSRPITSGVGIPILFPWTAVVSTAGQSPMMRKKNDGVVSYDSMTARKDVTYVEVESSHFELMVSKTVVKIIQNAIRSCRIKPVAVA